MNGGQSPAMPPASLEDIKQLVKQFEMMLPEDKRNAIWQTLNDIEASGGIRDEQHGQQLLQTLLQALGISF